MGGRTPAEGVAGAPQPFSLWGKPREAQRIQPGRPPGLVEMAFFEVPSYTPADTLSVFVEQNLQPDPDWKEELKDAWQRIERFFRERCFRDELVLDQEVRVLKVVKREQQGSIP